MGKQRELFPNHRILSRSPRRRKREVDNNIRKTIKRLAKGHPETEEEHEMAEQGGQEYWSTFRR